MRWCPGCGDFSILSQLKQVLAGLGVPREKLVFVSGMGCSSRLPYYLDTYGFQGLHGRAPALATGLKLANPELQVWVITGDGDGLAIGAGHLMHALRRNVDLKILLFNNETLGLTKGQHSPTSRTGTRTQTSPQGSVETPLRALNGGPGQRGEFRRAAMLDMDVGHLSEVLERAAAHRVQPSSRSTRIARSSTTAFSITPPTRAPRRIALSISSMAGRSCSGRTAIAVCG